MQVDRREITVSGSLLQPLIRRTNDLLRVVLAALFLAAVIVGSLITRTKWVDLENAIADIVGVLTPAQANLVYVVYGVAILALPFAILVRLIATRQWKLLAAYGAAGLIAVLSLSISDTGLSVPRSQFHLSDRLDTTVSEFVDDPRWIAMVAAMLTVSGPWLPARWRRWWWTLLLAFGPIHLVVSAAAPARSVFGLAVGWFVGAMVVLVVGTPALEVPLDAAVRELDRCRLTISGLTVVRPAGRGPLVLSATSTQPDSVAVVEMYGPNQRSGDALRALWQKLRLRSGEGPPLQGSLHRTIEHRALMALAVGDLGLANTSPIAVAELDRGWVLYAHTPPRGIRLDDCADVTLITQVWESLRVLHDHRISHGDLRAQEITVVDGIVRFGGFNRSEYGANDAQLQSDIAQLLVTTTALCGAQPTVAAALIAFGSDTVLTASRRLTKAAVPQSIRNSVPDPDAVISTARDEVIHQTGAEQIQPATITRFTRNQVIQLILLLGLVYVAYPFISSVQSFLSALWTANWWWAMLGLAVSALTYVGAATALWACADRSARFRSLVLLQFANTFAATTTPAGVGALALSARFLQKSGLSTVRAAAAVALAQAVQVITHVVLLMIFSAAAGASIAAGLARFVPSATALYLIVGLALGLVGAFLSVPVLRRWLRNAVRPRLMEVMGDLVRLAREPQRLTVIVLGCATIILGNALALWASTQAFGGGATFISVTIATMIGGTLASTAPTPGGVGAVEAALIGGLGAFGASAAVAVPSVLLYRVLTCWLPVFVGWPTMHWLTKTKLI